MLEKHLRKKKIFQCSSVPRPGCNFLMVLNNCNNSNNFAFFKQSVNALGKEKAFPLCYYQSATMPILNRKKLFFFKVSFITVLQQ